jgi:two-component system, NarL family, sensor histidine kinase DesK
VNKGLYEGTPPREGDPTEEYPADRSAPQGRDTTTRSPRLPRGGRLFGPLLGLFWLAYPVRAVLASDPSPAQLLFALSGAALFAGVFLWLLWLHEPLWSAPADPSEVHKRRAAIAVLAALAVVLVLFSATEWQMLFFHINVAAGIMLLKRDAYVAIAVLAVLTVALGSASGLAWLAVPTVAIGLWATAFARQVAAVSELRAAREEIARLAVSEERLRFARDLHDLLGHSLSLITLKSELAGRLLPYAPEKAQAEVRDIEGVARQALREVREAVAGYRQPTLDEELAGAREMLEAAGITCRIENGAGTLPGTTDAVLAWAVREGATNVIRHSRAERCEIYLSRDEKKIHAEITDDGRGSRENDVEAAGSGLSGLAERVAKGGGKLETGSLPEGGFRLRVSLPTSRLGGRLAGENERR